MSKHVKLKNRHEKFYLFKIISLDVVLLIIVFMVQYFLTKVVFLDIT